LQVEFPLLVWRIQELIMKSLSLSVILATLGRTEEPLETVRALLEDQAEPPDEIVVLDQNQPEIPALTQGLQKFPQVRHLRFKESGVQLNWNRGLQAANSELVLFLDDDVEVDRNLCRAHRLAHRNPKVRGIAGRVEQPSGDLDPARIREAGTYSRLSGSLVARFNSQTPGPCPIAPGGNMSFRRTEALRAGGMDRRFIGNAYYVESDFSLHVSGGESNGNLLFEPSATLKHLMAPRGGNRVLSKSLHHYYFTRNGLRLAKRHAHPAFRWLQFSRMFLYGVLKALKNLDASIFKTTVLGILSGYFQKPYPLTPLPEDPDSLTRKEILWIVPEQKGGIRTYAETLRPAVEAHLPEGVSLRFLTPDLSSRRKVENFLEELAIHYRCYSPLLVHLQHEYGLFGSRVPPLDTLPYFHDELRALLQNTPLYASAHTVLEPGAEFPWRNRGLALPLRFLLQKIFFRAPDPLRGLKFFDRVYVHSDLQNALIRKILPTTKVETLPHFIETEPRASIQTLKPEVLVFGYFSFEKGQHLALEAWPKLPRDLRRRFALRFIGDARRPKDQNYLMKCRKLAKKLGIDADVIWEGYLPRDKIASTLSQSQLLLAPFTSTSGSGSLALALAHGGGQILASDLPLNLEVGQRLPGALRFFQAGDSASLATELENSLKLPPMTEEELSKRRKQILDEYAPRVIGKKLVEGYDIPLTLSF
jgi:glycosyltransferase involved in cell wall biosynthesis/GT2 family glycosyltransferase